MVAPDHFEMLFDSATRAASRGSTPVKPRLVRAHHRARWNAGVLSGVSELVAEVPASAARILSLDPWTPVVLSHPSDRVTVGASASGTTVIWLDPTATAAGGKGVSLEWQLRARPDSEGRSFALGLPGDETSILTLELPAGWMPLGPEGLRQGPLPPSASKLQTWRFYGRPGMTNLELSDSRQGPIQTEGPRTWVSGPTRVFLGSSADTDPPAANWTTDWSVQAGPRGAIRFMVELDPGLELLGVSGPEVREFQIEKVGQSTRVQVVLAGHSQVPMQVRFEARARVPLEGRWSVPAIRPLDAIWTGGTTTIVLDPTHVIQDCHERAGRRIPAQGSDTSGADLLVFEASSPRSVADLDFRHPQAEASCLVRGRLYVGRFAPELECQLQGLGGRGSATEIEIDLPPTWVANRLHQSGRDEPLSWHPTVQADGSTRLHVLMPASEGEAESRFLLIGATSTAAGGRGPLVLPRVRPARVAIADETWVALVDSTLRVSPIAARGLVWLDPSRVEGPSEFSSPLGPELRPGLAWRWNAQDAEGRIDCGLASQEASVEIRYEARIDETGKHLLLEGEIFVESGQRPLTALPIWIGEAGSGSPQWSFRSGREGQALVPTALDDPSRLRHGFPASGISLSLPVETGHSGRSRILFQAERPWNHRGAIPLISTPRQFLPRGTILIEVPRWMRSRVEPAGLRRLEATVADHLAELSRQQVGPAPIEPSPGVRASPVAHALAYTEPGGKLDLITEDLIESRPTGIIRDACLTTVLHPSSPWQSRVRLLVQADLNRELRFTLPAETSLLRVRIEGRDLTPALDRGKLVVPLPAVGQGPRFETVDLDYTVAGGRLGHGVDLRPVVPDFGMPCVSFCWQLITPPGWEAGEQNPGLRASDPVPAVNWPFGALGLPLLTRPGQDRAVHSASNEMLRRLDGSLASASSEEVSFAEWFTRWDSVSVPLIIDRQALGAAGYGPRSRCRPIRTDPGGESASQKTLEQYGLALVPLDLGLVVTSRAEAAMLASPERWRSVVGEALHWGNDRTDRFQTVARWRGEITPTDASDGGIASTLRALPDWSTWRFTAASWPGEAARIQLRDRRLALLPGWAVAVLVLLALRFGRRSPRWGIIVPMTVMTAAVLVHLWQAPRFGNPTAGVFLGATITLLYRLGAYLADSPRSRRRRARAANPSSRLPRVLLRASPTILVVVLSSLERAEGRRDEDSRIPVLLPYEGPYQPGQSPKQVVLREADYQLLDHLSRPLPSESPEPILIGATHHVSWSGDQDVVVQSELVLRNPGPAPAMWKVPVGGARDISATLDGHAATVFIEAGGTLAAVPLQSAGDFKLRLRRTATLFKDGPLDSLVLPVNPMPSARLIIDKSSRSNALRRVNSGGNLKTMADQSVAVELGPADHLRVWWGDRDAAAAPVAAANVDGVILWDIEPAGDLLRARFTYRGLRRLTSLSFQLDPGLIPRSIQIPGMIAEAWSGTAVQPVWTARIDPPLPEGTTIELHLWRPFDPGNRGKEGAADGSRQNGSTGRRFPRLEPLQVQRYSGLLGIRRPSNWTGRLEPVAGADPLGDESFVRAWGQLPDNRLTLSGTTRLVRNDSPQFQTGPSTARMRTRGALDLRIDPGRIGVEYKAELGEAGEPLYNLEIAVPQDLVVLGVRSDGLTDWSRKALGLLLVRYDRTLARSPHSLRISGWIPVADDPLKMGAAPRRMPTPWISIPGMENLPGTLGVSSSSRAEVSGARGLSADSSAPAAGASDAEQRAVQTYRVEDPAQLGVLQWNTTLPRVNVQIESQLTIHPDSAEWVAVLSYDVRGGALGSIHVRVSSPWALKAQIQLGEGDFRIRSDALGPVAFWTITPARPIWGSERLVVRSALPLSPGQEVRHPEITPLGRGVVDTYLGLVNASGNKLTRAGSKGLQEVTYASRFRAREFVRLPETETRAYHVEHEGWTLKVQIPQSPDEMALPGNESARLLSAEQNATILADRSLVGRAVYQTQARSGRFLAVGLPPSSTMIWATVDQNPVAPLLSPDKRWLIPLGGQGPYRVCTFWSEGAGSASLDRSWSISLPRAGLDRVPTLVTIHLAEELAIKPSAPGLEPTVADRMDLERGDRISRQITELSSQIDRRSGRDRERITALLISHEMALRGAEESLRWNGRQSDRARWARVERDLELIRTARKAVLETLRAAALEDVIETAQDYLGLAKKPPETTAIATPEPASIDRIRALGQPTFLIGLAPGLNEEPTTISGSWEGPGVLESDPADHARSMILLGVLVALGLSAAARALLGAWGYLILAVLLGLLGFMGGPVILAGGMALAVAGWASRLRVPHSPSAESMLSRSRPNSGSSLA
jgi:hypothetical protein